MSDTFTTPLRIDATHPALPGHFPGHPVVPGVVVLQQVAAALKKWRDVRIARFDVKFVQPLLPGQNAAITLRDGGACIRFMLTRDDATLASGVLLVEAAP